MFYKNLLIVLFVLVFGKGEAQNHYDEKSFNKLKDEIIALSNSMTSEGYAFNWEDTTSWEDTTGLQFMTKVNAILKYPQTSSFNFKEFPGFDRRHNSPDGKLKVFTFVIYIQGYKYPDIYTFVQFKKTNGQLGANYINALSPDSIFQLRSKSLNQYLITTNDLAGGSYQSYGAFVCQLKGDSLIINYPAFPNDKSFISFTINADDEYMHPLQYNDKNQTISLEFNASIDYYDVMIKDKNDQTTLPQSTTGARIPPQIKAEDKRYLESKSTPFLYPNPINENSETYYNYTLKFNGTKFVQVKHE